MIYINPIDLLSLNKYSINEINNSVIRKAKRRIQAEIELSDHGYIFHNGCKITSSDADKAINELDDHEKLEFYHFLANNIELNNFLSSGDERFFIQFRQNSIYALDSFIEFVSPFFTEKYEKALYNAFQNDDITRFKLIVSVKPLVTSSDNERAYIGVSKSIKEKVEEVAEIIRNIAENDFDESAVDDLFDWVQLHFKVTIINSLPQYFQSLRNQIASSLRNLSVNIFNAYGRSQIAFDIINYALTLNIDGLTKDKIAGDHYKIKEINEQHLEEHRLAPMLRKYANILIELKSKIAGIENRTISVSSINLWITASILISELNALNSTFNEIKNQLALGLRALSVVIWNSYKDIDTALFTINKALAINSNVETKSNLTDARNQLNELKIKIDSIKQIATSRTLQYHKTNKSTSNSSKNQGLLVFLGITIVIVIIIALSNSNKSTLSHSNPTQATSSNYPNSSNPTINNNSTNGTNSEPEKLESQFKGNQLVNGSSPLDNCFGKGKYSGQSWIRFDNSNASDAIVCLVAVYSSKTIRNEYIRAGSAYTMNNIPSGTYKLKVYYGNDWNPTKTNFCGISGAFDTDEHFSKSDKTSDYIEVSNTEESYTTGSITLYSVTNGNMSSESTTAADFFSN